MKSSTVVTALTLSLSMMACSAEAPQDETGSVAQGLDCITNSGVNPTKAALAVAMANELGEWKATENLTHGPGGVELSAAGEAKCAAAGGCPNVEAILGLQDDAVRNYIPQNVFLPNTFRSSLLSALDAQKNLIQNLSQNAPEELPPTQYTLVFQRVEDNGACGLHYVWKAENANAPVANLINELAFYGAGTYGGDNPFIDFSSDASTATVKVDPQYGDNEDDTTPGSCTQQDVCRIYDPGRVYLDDCCTCDGLQGTLQILPPMPLYLYCAT